MNKLLLSSGQVPGVNWDSNLLRDRIIKASASNGTILVVFTENVSTGNLSRCFYSEDGVVWKYSTSVLQNILSLTWSASLAMFIAVGTGGAIYTSLDAKSWTLRVSNISSTIEFVTVIGSTIIAVGTLGKVLRSTNGTDWSLISLPTTNAMQAAGGTTSMMLIGGQASTLFYSTNTGVTWSQITLPTTTYIRAIGYSGTNFILIRDDGTSTSTNGLAWTNYTNNITSGTFFSIKWTGTEFLVCGGNGGVLIGYSVDGVTWTVTSNQIFPPITSGSNHTAYSISIHNNKTYVFGGTSSGINNGVSLLTSTNNRTWSNDISGTNYSLNSVTYNGSMYVAVGNFGEIVTSPDLVNWTRSYSGTTQTLNAVRWVGNKFIAVGAGGIILTSLTGSIWGAQNSGTTTNLLCIYYDASNSIILIGGVGGVLKSNNTSTSWQFYSPETNNVRSITKGPNNNYILAGATGVWTSSDGQSWTTVNTGNLASSSVKSISYSNSLGIYVAGMTSLLGVYSSTDLSTWTTRTGSGLTAWEVYWTGTAFISTFENSRTISYSIDGVSWRSIPVASAPWGGLRGVYGDDKNIVSVGIYGYVASSPPSGPILI